MKTETKMWIAGAVGATIAAVIMLLVTAVLVMPLWNTTIPDLTNGTVKAITFWDSLKLSLLCSALVFGGYLCNDASRTAATVFRTKVAKDTFRSEMKFLSKLKEEENA